MPPSEHLPLRWAGSAPGAPRRGRPLAAWAEPTSMRGSKRTTSVAPGMAPLDGSPPQVPLLDSVLPIPDSDLMALEIRRYSPPREARPEAIDIDLDRVQEMLAKHVPPEPMTRPRHLDTVRAQLQSVVLGVPVPPPPAPVALPVQPPAAARTVDDAAARTAPAPAEPAPGLVELTLRAEAAEARAERLQAQVTALEAQISAQRATNGVLGRRFGQRPHETFAQFVARLGMTARAVPLSRAKGSPTGGDTV